MRLLREPLWEKFDLVIKPDQYWNVHICGGGILDIPVASQRLVCNSLVWRIAANLHSSISTKQETHWAEFIHFSRFVIFSHKNNTHWAQHVLHIEWSHEPMIDHREICAHRKFWGSAQGSIRYEKSNRHRLDHFHSMFEDLIEIPWWRSGRSLWTSKQSKFGN